MSVINAVAANGNKSAAHGITFLHKGKPSRLSLAELDALAGRLLQRLRAAGFARGDRIGIVARNSLEWVLVDLAAIKGGLMTAGFEFGKFKPTRQLMTKYGLKGLYADADDPGIYNVRPLVKDVVSSHKAGERDDIAEAPVTYRPNDCTTIKFTSGSTGEPKGLCATVGSIDSSLAAVQTLFHHEAGDNVLVFLPLSLLQQRYWIYSALAYGHDITVVPFEFALEAAQKVQPTVIMGVPGFFEGIKKQIERDAELNADDLRARRTLIESLLGNRIRYLWTGSAPAGAEMLHFFDDCGIPIYEGYGMNETCIVTKNYPGHQKIGSVGKVLPNKRVRIDADGMLIVGGEYPVNTAYLYCAPGENEKIFLPNGEVRTGDLARIDEDGFLYILGRADDVVVLANGKNVYARRVEERIKEHKAIEECVLYGSGKPYLVAVISPAESSVNRDSIVAHIEAVNATLRPDERVVKAFIAPERFTVAGGLLTSQFKPKRKEIFKTFKQEIDQLYGVTA